MSAANVVENLLANVPKAVAAAVVDVGTRQFLAMKSNDAHPEAVTNLVPVTITQLFEGTTVAGFTNVKNDTFEAHYVREVFVSTKTHLYMFKRLEKQENNVLVIATEMDMSNAALFTLVLMKVRDIASQATF